MSKQYADLTLEEAQTEAFEELVYEVVEGWFQDERMDLHDLCDRIDDSLMFDTRFSTSDAVKCLPAGDTDQPIYKHLKKIARKAKRELNS